MCVAKRWSIRAVIVCRTSKLVGSGRDLCRWISVSSAVAMARREGRGRGDKERFREGEGSQSAERGGVEESGGQGEVLCLVRW
jgi:hypothetical protein